MMDETIDLTETEPAEDLKLRADAVKAQGTEFYKKGDYRHAVALYSQAIEILPTAGVYYSNRAAALMMLRRYYDAANDCKRAMELDGESTKLASRASKCYLHMGNLDEAVSILKHAKTSVHGNAHALQTLDRELSTLSKIQSFMVQVARLMQAKQYKQALTQLEMAMITLDPTLKTSSAPGSVTRLKDLTLDTIPLHWRLVRGDCLLELRDLEGAAAVTIQILTADDTNAEAITLRARVMYLQDVKPETIPKLLLRALSFDPDNVKAREFLRKIRRLDAIKVEGNDATRAGQYMEAQDAYTRYLEADDECGVPRVKVLSNRATVRSKLAKFELASADCTLALDLLDQLSFPGVESPSAADQANSSNSALFSKLYLRRADCSMKLEKYEEAARDYGCAEKLDPHNGEISRAARNAQNLLRQSKRKDYYKILGLDRGAGESEIKKAYRKAALQYHPDKVASASDEDKLVAEDKFKEIGEAYTVLSDPRKKEMFDSGMDIDGSSASDGMHGHSPFGHGGGGGPQMDDILKMFFAQGGGGGGGMHQHQHQESGGFGGESPFGAGGFPGGSPFGGNAGRRRQAPHTRSQGPPPNPRQYGGFF
ncbi:hypothetical protein HKX48_008802 [Thoreauomyces humboldtii]|nr:hypothetical protein HKX48_008802 [Thoreauomyces humboldtii]